eukprot:1914692-Prymnesium_polylepis.1
MWTAEHCAMRSLVCLTTRCMEQSACAFGADRVGAQQANLCALQSARTVTRRAKGRACVQGLGGGWANMAEGLAVDPCIVRACEICLLGRGSGPCSRECVLKEHAAQGRQATSGRESAAAVLAPALTTKHKQQGASMARSAKRTRRCVSPAWSSRR